MASVNARDWLSIHSVHSHGFAEHVQLDTPMMKAMLHGIVAFVLAGFSVVAAMAAESWSWHFWGFLSLGCLATLGVLVQFIEKWKSARF